jgi:hypothetical protein
MQEMDEFKEELEFNSTALEKEAQGIVQTSGLLTDNLVKANKIVWRMLAFIWAVMICLLIAYGAILSRNTFDSKSGTLDQLASTTPAGQKDLSVTSPVPSSPPAPAEYFPKLLNRIQEAQLKKDIDLFLSAYSPSFPEISKKREQTLQIWKDYDFLEIQYLIDDVQPKDSQNFLAKVTWKIKAQHLDSNKIKRFLKSYRVCFSKGSGEWLIQNIETLDDPK